MPESKYEKGVVTRRRRRLSKALKSYRAKVNKRHGRHTFPASKHKTFKR